eukprot:104669_1
MCNIFCKAFRKQKISKYHYERIESVIHRNEKIANWAKLLIESVQCFGKFQTGSTKFYRGIDLEFVFKKFITRFHVPLSTTTDFGKAAEFAQGAKGLVMELKRYNEYISGLDCSMLSIFDVEKEVLFFGSDSIFQIKSIYQWYDNKWFSYRNYINGIQSVIKIANGSIEWNHRNNMKHIFEYLLPNAYNVASEKKLPPYIQSLLRYHLQNTPDEIEYDFTEIIHSYQWVQDIF